MNPEQIDPTLGLTPEKSSKPQLDPILQSISDSHSSIKSPSRVTPHTRISGVDLGTDMFGKSNLERVSEEYGGVNIISQNFEQLRAAEQPWWHQAAGFINQVAIGEIVGGTLEGLGYLAELPFAINTTGQGEQEFGNALSNFGKSIREWSQEATPIYQENPGTFNPGDSGWWFGNGVSIASALSLMIPSMAATKGLSLLGKGLRYTAGARQLGRFGKGVNNVMDVIQGGKLLSNQVIAKGVTQAVFSRHMENMMEASGTFEDTFNEAKRLNPGISDEEARAIAGKAASENYKLGWAMLAQDIVQYTLMAKFRMPGTTATNKLEEAMYKGLGKSKVAQFLNKNRGIGNGITQFVSEGMEETYQFIASQEAQNLALYDAGLIDNTQLSERLGEYAKDGEMWTSAFFGGFGGLASDIVGGRAQSAKLKEFQQAQLQWINARGAQFAKVANDMTKASEAQDPNAMIKASKDLNLTMTVEALNHGTFDYHVQQMEEMAGMSDDQLAAYNQAHPGMEITPEFRDKLLPELIRESREVAEDYEKNLDRFDQNTVGAITQKNHTQKYFDKRSREYKQKLEESLNTLPFEVDNRAALDLELKKDALESQKESMDYFNRNTTDEFNKNESAKIKSEIETELAEVEKQLAELEVSKEDKDKIKSIKSNADVARNNMTQATAKVLADLEGRYSNYLQSSEYQAQAQEKAFEQAINLSVSEEMLNAADKAIKQAQMKNSKKKELLEQVEKQREKIKLAEKEYQAKSAEAQAEKEIEEAAAATQESVEPTTPQETSNTTQGSELGVENDSMSEFEKLGFKPPQNKPPIEPGTRVVVKAGVHKGKEGLVTDKTDEAGRAYVSFNPNKPPHPYNPDNLEIVNPVITNPAKPQGTIPTPENDISESSETSQETSNEETVDIEAKKADKYDAELAALEQPTTTPETTIEETLESSTEVETQAEVQEQPRPSNPVRGKLNVVVPKTDASGAPKFAYEWHTWVNSSNSIDGTPIIFEPVNPKYQIGGKSKEESDRLHRLFGMLQRGEESKMSSEDKKYLIDHYPLQFKVLDGKGNVVTINGKNVSNFLYEIRDNTAPDIKLIERQLRGKIIKRLAKDGKLQTNLAMGVSNAEWVDNSKNSGETVENSIDIFDGHRVSDNGTDFVVAGQNGTYIMPSSDKNENGAIDPDLSWTKGNAMPGNIFIKLERPSDGKAVPAKLNRGRITEEDANFIIDILSDVISNSNVPSFLATVRINEVPEREKQLRQMIPNYELMLGKNPLMGDVMNFFIQHNNSEVAARTTKENYNPRSSDMFIMSKQGKINFNFTQKEDGAFTHMQVDANTINNPEMRQHFVSFLQNSRRYNIDAVQLRENKEYAKHIIDSKKLNTDVTSNVWQKDGGKITVNVETKRTLEPKEPTKEAVAESPIIKEAVENPDNSTNAKTGNGVSVTTETESLKEAKVGFKNFMNKRLKDKENPEGGKC